MDSSKGLEAGRDLARGFAGLRMLVLHGSRARGDAHAQSDWDFAYLGDSALDELGLRHCLVGALHSDNLDLVTLARAGGYLRYRVAKDGLLLFEVESGAFDEFCYRAASFWLDIEPVIRAEYRAILDRLG